MPELYDAARLKEMIEQTGEAVDQHEITRLLDNYASYEKPRRYFVPDAFLGEVSVEELILDKIAKDNGRHAASNQALGAHKNKKWASRKIRNTLFRILYLRYRIDEGCSPRRANAKILRIFPGYSGQPPGAASQMVSRATKGAKFDPPIR